MQAILAVQFVINYEEGAESCILHGDTESECLLSEIVGAQPLQGARNITMESMYGYGSRAGFWRLHRLFVSKGLPVTVYACGMALERNPAAGKAMVEAGWEVASHGYRWIDYKDVDEAVEREHIRKAVEVTTKVCGQRPVGIYQGKPSVNSRRREGAWPPFLPILIVEEGGFLYDADAYDDDLPYWNTEYGRPHLVVPYTLDVNDMRFATPQGFNSGDQFFTYLRDAFDVLLEEGRSGAPKMLSIGLHCRLVGHPGRIKALGQFLDHVKKAGSDVWVCKREDIARHWHEKHPITRL
ncbi:unnamed protein product [Discosporangium mesarthrocarpum]